MASVNRLLLGLLALVVLALAVLLVAAPQLLTASLEAGVRGLAASTVTERLAAATTLSAVALILLLLEIWRPSPRVLESRFEGGSVVYAAETVAAMVERALLPIEGIETARVRLAARRGKVRVVACLQIVDGSDPQHVAAAAAGHLRETLVQRFELEVADLRLLIRPHGAHTWRSPLRAPQVAEPLPATTSAPT